MAVEEKVIILDFGGQYTQLIARMIREQKVYCEIKPYNVSLEELLQGKPSALIFSGGPASVYEPEAPCCDPRFYRLGIPVLGICYGMQLMARDLGGEVVQAPNQEYGRTFLSVIESGELLKGWEKFEAWMSHADQVTAVPPDSGFLLKAKIPRWLPWPTKHKLMAYNFTLRLSILPGSDSGQFLFRICCFPESGLWKAL